MSTGRVILILCLASLLAACGNASAGRQVAATTATPQPPRVQTTAHPPTATSSPQPTALPTLQPTPEFMICSPLDEHPLSDLKGIISDPYRPPPPGKDMRHHGVDFSYYRYGERTTIQGVGVQAVLAGRVAAALENTYPFGNMVILETPGEALPDGIRQSLEILPGQSLYTMYAHMDSPPLVESGGAVQSCQALGYVGKSGNTVEPHLHLEARRGPSGAVFNSMGYYQANHTEEEKANYLLWRTSGVFQHFDPLRLLEYGIMTPTP